MGPFTCLLCFDLAYRCYVPDLKPVFASKDVTFIEKLCWQASSTTFEVLSELKNSEEERYR